MDPGKCLERVNRGVWRILMHLDSPHGFYLENGSDLVFGQLEAVLLDTNFTVSGEELLVSCT